MDLHHLHDWNLSPADAIALQKQLAARVVFDRPLDLARVRRVAGVDVSVRPGQSDTQQGDPNAQRGHVSYAAVVVLSFPELEPLETATASMPTPFPYIPGLLSFREGPVLEKAFAALNTEPDALIFDGMGRAHPRRLGIAAHMGLWLDKPTAGCGKTLFVGKYVEPPVERGAHAPLVDKGEQVGVILRTRERTRPVFISPGHLIDLPSAVELVMRCTGKYRLPEPIRAAHHAAGAVE